MQTPASPDPDHEATSAPSERKAILEPDYSGAAQPIGAWTERADYPQCVLGAHVSIHGFAGVVVEIVNQSIKVLSPDGITQRFNAYRLKTLFAPPDRSTPVPQGLSAELSRPGADSRPAPDEPEAATLPRVHITSPDFAAPVCPIRRYASQPDFPQCAYGKHVDIPGYSGVVVEIVNGSLKVQSPAGTIRSYNGGVLKKIYGRS